MDLRSGRLREMIDHCLANESCIPCHHLHYEGPNDACCRGFFDRYPTQPLQIAERLGLIVFVD